MWQKVEKNGENRKKQKKIFGELSPLHNWFRNKFKIGPKSLDKKFIRRKDIGQKDMDKVSLDELTSDKKLVHGLQL